MPAHHGYPYANLETATLDNAIFENSISENAVNADQAVANGEEIHSSGGMMNAAYDLEIYHYEGAEHPPVPKLRHPKHHPDPKPKDAPVSEAESEETAESEQSGKKPAVEGEKKNLVPRQPILHHLLQ